MKVWVDGELVDEEEAKLTVYDHGTLYGDGVFEGIRVYGGRIFQCQAHIDRLFNSAKQIRLAIPYTKQEIIDAMEQTVASNGAAAEYIRLVITRGVGTLGLNPFLCPRPSVFVIADQIALYPPEMYEHGMAVIVAKTVRTSPRMVNPGIKSLNYLINILAKIEAIDAGVAEAIMLNEHGRVAECTGDNVFIVDGGRVVTPPLTASILGGITRAVVLRLAAQQNIPLGEEEVSVQRLMGAAECFLTGTAAEVIAVTRIDDQPIGGGRAGPVTQKLCAAFREYIASGQW
ncbi:MAG TPA: branched-chain-amino-acid transaminase [Phycisphaerae bacterium]|nr:branched-chain-amino-acid transaminase [Phycisphaerae bacterium]